MTRSQQLGYSAAEVGAFGGKVGAGLAIARATGLTAALMSGGPVTIGMAASTVVYTAAAGVTIEVAKQLLLELGQTNR